MSIKKIVYDKYHAREKQIVTVKTLSYSVTVWERDLVEIFLLFFFASTKKTYLYISIAILEITSHTSAYIGKSLLKTKMESE